MTYTLEHFYHSLNAFLSFCRKRDIKFEDEDWYVDLKNYLELLDDYRSSRGLSWTQPLPRTNANILAMISDNLINKLQKQRVDFPEIYTEYDLNEFPSFLLNNKYQEYIFDEIQVDIVKYIGASFIDLSLDIKTCTITKDKQSFIDGIVIDNEAIKRVRTQETEEFDASAQEALNTCLSEQDLSEYLARDKRDLTSIFLPIDCHFQALLNTNIEVFHETFDKEVLIGNMSIMEVYRSQLKLYANILFTPAKDSEYE